MSELSDSTQQSVAGKRSASPDPGRASPPSKAARAAVGSGALVPGRHDVKNSDTAGRTETKESGKSPTHGENGSAPITTRNTTALPESGDAYPSTSSSSGVGPCTSSSSSGDAHPQTLSEAGNGSAGVRAPCHSPPPEQSDWAAIAAAEALASLTRVGEDERTEQAHTSRQAGFRKKNLRKSSKRGSPVAREQSPTAGKSLLAQAAAADSSTSSPEGGAVDSADRQRLGLLLGREEEEEEGDGFLSGFSSSQSSSFPSEEEAEDAECAIVSVKMAAETRQSVASLAQVQVRLEALERKSARLHQRLELKLSQQRRPHLEQRSAIIRTIPGFWVTALLNHPLLSAHIDESDEEALSSMSHLEVESLKNTRMGYRISFHFNCNSYFQNATIFKEFHLGLGGSMASFSSPILWHRGQDLTSQGASGKESGSFFCWFSDHSEPGHDQIAQILKEDLYRNPLRYYLTPLWEPRENGSGHRGMDHSSGNECVVISDSEEDEDEGGARRDEEEDADTGSGDSEDGEQHDDDSSDREEEEEEDEEEELDVEELDEEQESSSPEVKGQEEEEEEEEGGAGGGAQH
ncbi:putative testis-specific Y-encoded-like protein 3 [Anguilla rostrata]|uniref:putative testis-specific Y-encoded-like protein 3 n=1 Tax=Anguilla rostrata TaxID=7938 RepID=UPI0030D0173D